MVIMAEDVKRLGEEEIKEDVKVEEMVTEVG